MTKTTKNPARTTKILKLTNGGINWKWQDGQVHLSSNGILTCSDYYGWKIIEKPLTDKNKATYCSHTNACTSTYTDTEPDLGTYFLATRHEAKKQGIAGSRIKMFSGTLDGIMWKINQLQYTNTNANANTNTNTNTNANGTSSSSESNALSTHPRPKPQVYGRGR